MSRSPEPDLADLRGDARVLWTEDVLRFGDTDANGHINNSAFSVFCESGRVHFMDRIIVPTLPSGRFFVIVRLAIDFKAELFYPGKVRVGTWVSALGRTSATFRQVLLDDADTIVARSEAIGVALEAGTRRPDAYGPATRAAIESWIRPDA